MGKNDFGATDEYAKALQFVIAEGVPEQHMNLLQAHCEAPRRTRTARELAEAVGYANFNAVNLQYGTLAHRVASRLGVLNPPEGFWLYVLVDWASSFDSNGHTRFVLRKQVVEALDRLGYSWARGVRPNKALQPTDRGKRKAKSRKPSGAGRG